MATYLSYLPFKSIFFLYKCCDFGTMSYDHSKKFLKLKTQDDPK